jgi:hypothetical protein
MRYPFGDARAFWEKAHQKPLLFLEYKGIRYHTMKYVRHPERSPHRDPWNILSSLRYRSILQGSLCGLLSGCLTISLDAHHISFYEMGFLAGFFPKSQN